jgi:hypothetical protein
MNTLRWVALSVALVLLSATSLAQEKKEGAGAAPPAAKQAPPASPPAAAAPGAPGAPAAPPAEQRGVVKDDEFIPSQDIPPDEGVTFPVGI